MKFSTIRNHRKAFAARPVDVTKFDPDAADLAQPGEFKAAAKRPRAKAKQRRGAKRR